MPKAGGEKNDIRFSLGGQVDNSVDSAAEALAEVSPGMDRSKNFVGAASGKS
jgi:hypothetical protein